MSPRTVRVPEHLRSLFADAERVVSTYFRNRVENPELGTIEVVGERYVLVRAASLSIEFFRVCEELFGDGREDEADAWARNMLFDISHAVGKSDAKNFHAKMSLTDPVQKMSAGPVHFAHAGWAFVDISPESNPVSSEEFLLLYEHRTSFEADAWVAAGQTPLFPVCIMSSGYSSGWCDESFGIPVVAVEVECRARGDAACRFVMAHTKNIERHVAARAGRMRPNIPDFFARKRMEDELRLARDGLEKRVAEDVARREKVERQLDQARRLEALGRLAGGIAHDFNNLIAVMLANTSLIRDQLDPRDPRAQFADDVISACDRGTKLVKQLLAFGRSQSAARERLELGAAVERARGMFERLVGERIELAMPDAIPDAWIDFEPAQLDQVFLNLIVNARDAMPQGGRITITIGKRVITRERAEEQEIKPGPYVTLTVEDTGVGIPVDVLPKIFEPFFTTKRDAGGTGLGLATVYGVVRHAGGVVHVESTVGKGSRFEIALPAASAPDHRESAKPQPVATPTKGTILVVEDERELRSVIKTILDGLGYRVLVARDVEHALELAEGSADIDLLLTDVVMPKMSGTELAARVRAIRPGVKVLLMTGYADAAQSRSGEAWLMKPFKLEALAQRVREVLAR